MTISEKIISFPEYAKDIKLNYSKILNEGIFNKKQIYNSIKFYGNCEYSNYLKKLII